MLEAIKIWNEPNNLSHWDFRMDPEWKVFSEMLKLASLRVRECAPNLPIVLGGMSPIDPGFLDVLIRNQVLQYVDVVAIHGFPLDWNHWKLDEWPNKLEMVKKFTNLPVWITEVGISSFGCEEVQCFGLEKTQRLLKNKSERIFWYSLLDLPPTWAATTRHQEQEGSSYYRHYYMGLIRADGTRKPAFDRFDPSFGICQWFHYEDPRLEFAVEALRELGVKKLRTGLSWSDSHKNCCWDWFDHQMEALEDFDVTLTLCFTPNAEGRRPDHTSPPKNPEAFADFAEKVVNRYFPGRQKRMIA